MRTYPVQFAVTVVAISLMAMGIIFISYDSRHQKLQNLILQKKNEELKAAIAMQKQLRRKAQTDLLTGLKNKPPQRSSAVPALRMPMERTLPFLSWTWMTLSILMTNRATRLATPC